MATNPSGRKIEVPLKIILRASRRNSSHCMIAKAIKLQHPEMSHVSVDIQTIRMTNDKEDLRYFYLTPRKAQLAIINFDQGNTVEPFTFQLPSPHIVPVHRKVATKEERVLEKKKSAPKIKVHTSPAGGASIVETIGPRLPQYKVGRRRTFGLRTIEA